MHGFGLNDIFIASPEINWREFKTFVKLNAVVKGRINPILEAVECASEDFVEIAAEHVAADISVVFPPGLVRLARLLL